MNLVTGEIEQKGWNAPACHTSRAHGSQLGVINSHIKVGCKVRIWVMNSLKFESLLVATLRGDSPLILCVCSRRQWEVVSRVPTLRP